MKILICVCASVAIYKVCELTRKLKQQQHEVKIILSHAAQKMISITLFEALGADIYTEDTGKMEHIYLSRWCDILVLCPATASTIGKIANGIGGTLMLDIFLAKKQNIRTIIVPSMNVEMWNNSFVQANINKLKSHNFEIINPTSGVLACGEEGLGKMACVEDIIDFINPHIKTLNVLITAGGTVEKLDDVRYLTNFSSGKQALEISQILYDCTVTVIKAKADVSFPCNVIQVESAKEMLDSVQKELEAGKYDVFISCAAVADFTFNKTNGKIKKDKIHNLELIPNPDILKTVCSSPKKPKCVIGFAAEAENILEHAKQKMVHKGCDIMIANELVFGKDETKGFIITKHSTQDFNCSKKDLAKMIKNKIFEVFSF